MSDPRTATLEFIEAQLADARKAVVEWTKFRQSVMDGAPLAAAPAPAPPAPAPAPTPAPVHPQQVARRPARLTRRIAPARAVRRPPANGHRPKLRDAVLSTFTEHRTTDYDLTAMHRAVASYGFSRNAVRGVLYQLRDERVVIAVPGDTKWSPTLYHLAPVAPITQDAILAATRGR